VDPKNIQDAQARYERKMMDEAVANITAYEAFLDSHATCPGCGHQDKVRAMAKIKSSNILGSSSKSVASRIDRMECSNHVCGIHFKPPENEVVPMHSDYYWSRRAG
jgi:hypothetical protein